MSAPTYRIIIIDDNPSIHNDFKKIINASRDNELSQFESTLFGDDLPSQPEGNLPLLEIETASQGEEGVVKIEQGLRDGHVFSLAFVDIRMPPGIDGIETIRRIWEIDPTIQIVICTAFSDYTWEETINALGLSDGLLVLKKPFDTLTVKQLVTALTRKWSLYRETQQYTESLNRLVDERTNSLQYSLTLLRATIELSTDGILVVDLNNTIVDYNSQFVHLWNVPKSIMASKDKKKLFKYLLSQQLSPAKNRMRMKIRHKKEDSSIQLIYLKNKNTFECESKPHRVGEKIVGRVWSFHNITESVKLNKQLEYRATHDSLTDLPNRSLFIERCEVALTHSIANKTKFAIFYLDLDRFKLVNNNLGHKVGDQFICEIAKCLSSGIRKKDILARLSGDEFVLGIPLIKDDEPVVSIAHKVFHLFNKPFAIGKHKLKITVSAGISVYPMDGATVNTLLNNAELATYQAKSRGGNQFAFHTHELNVKSKHQFHMEFELQRAIVNKEFFLVYQPQFDIEHQTILSLEALIRWKHSEKGIIAPMEFLPVTESSGLIIQIGEWVIREACRQIVEWRNKGFPLFTVAVNVAAKQLWQNNFATRVKQILDEFELDPACLGIEITENVILNSEVQQTIQHLKQIGCDIILDDFGTGNSSLGSLKQLQIDYLKIDKSFVDNISKSIEDEVMIGAMIDISHSMNIKVTAEGVETQTQVDFLKSKHCDEIQGFLWSKPLSVEQCEVLFKIQGLGKA